MEKLGDFVLNKIYCMDCLEGLKKIPDNSVDLVLTDPLTNENRATGVVALKQNKKFIGIELNPKYIEIANKRLKPFLEQTKLLLSQGTKRSPYENTPTRATRMTGLIE